MKKSVVLILLFIMTRSFGFAQNSWRDVTRQDLANASSDTIRVLLLIEMCNDYKFDRPDSALYYGYNALTLARKIKFIDGELKSINLLALTELTFGNELKALLLNFEGIKIAEKNNLNYHEAFLKLGMGRYYYQVKEYEKALSFTIESKNIFDSIHNVNFSAVAQSYIGVTFLKLNQPDSAMYYCQLSYDNQQKEKWVDYYSTFNLGKVHEMIGNTEHALELFRQSLSKATEADNLYSSNLAIAKLYQQTEINNA